jgi:hypothetical protein
VAVALVSPWRWAAITFICTQHLCLLSSSSQSHSAIPSTRNCSIAFAICASPVPSHSGVAGCAARNSLYSLGSIDLRVGAGARRGLDGAPRWWAALHIGGAGDVRSRGWLVEGRQAERACRSRMLRIPAVDTTSRGWGAWSLLTHNCAALQTITPIVCCTEVR